MAASNIEICFQSGKMLSGYVAASAAAGSLIKLSKEGVAGANDPDVITLDETDVITDVFCTAVSGAFEIIKDDKKTGRIISANTCQASNAGRRRFTIGVFGSVPYRLRVVSPFPA